MGEEANIHVEKQPQRPRVSIDEEVWRAIDALLGDLPFRTAYPIIAQVHATGGVLPVE